MRWDLFDLAVSTARRVVPDDDVARDVALKALEELGETATSALVVLRARSRAKDAARAHARRPAVYNEDMDLHASVDNVVEQASENELRERLRRHIGPVNAALLEAKAAGFTNAELAAVLLCSEEKVRLMVSAAELLRDTRGV